MFGLIRKLAKLLVIVKNLPKLLTFIPKLLSSPTQVSSMLAKGMIADDLENMINTMEENKTNILESLASDSNEEIENIRASNLSDSRKQELIQRVRITHQEQLNSINSGFRDSIISGSRQMVNDKLKAIEPSFMTAISPLALMVGIPDGVGYVAEKLSGATKTIGLLNTVGAGDNITFGGVGEYAQGLSGAKESEDEFNAAVSAAENAANPSTSDFTFAHGRTGKQPAASPYYGRDYLHVYTDNKTNVFKYDAEGNAITQAKFLINDDRLILEKFNYSSLNYNELLSGRKGGDNAAFAVLSPALYTMTNVKLFIQPTVEVSIEWSNKNQVWVTVDWKGSPENSLQDMNFVFSVRGYGFFLSNVAYLENTITVPLIFNSTRLVQQ